MEVDCDLLVDNFTLSYYELFRCWTSTNDLIKCILTSKPLFTSLMQIFETFKADIGGGLYQDNFVIGVASSSSNTRLNDVVQPDIYTSVHHHLGVIEGVIRPLPRGRGNK